MQEAWERAMGMRGYRGSPEWKTTIHVGVYWEGFDFDLKPRRWLWLAYLFARWHLFVHPYRSAKITKA